MSVETHAEAPCADNFVLNRLTEMSPVRCLRTAATLIWVVVPEVGLGCGSCRLRTFDLLQKC
jgi:hypothetical protein